MNLISFIVCSGCAVLTLTNDSPIAFLVCLLLAAINLGVFLRLQGWIK